METPTTPEEIRDAEHLKLLALFHYVVGGLMIAFSCIFFIHVAIGILMLTKPEMLNPPNQHGPVMPAAFAWLFILLPGTFIIFSWIIGGLTILSGRRIATRRSRTFSIVVAAIDCLFVPFGTVLGVFTLIVLTRDS